MGESRGFKEKPTFPLEIRKEAVDFLRNLPEGLSQPGSDTRSDYEDFCKRKGVVSRSDMDSLWEQAQVDLLAEREVANQDRPDDSIFVEDPRGATELMFERIRQLRDDH